MMISVSEDEDRIEDVRRRHIIQRRPEDAHWRDIDALLFSLEQTEREKDEYLDETKHEHSFEIDSLKDGYEKQFARFQEVIDGLNDKIADLEEQLATSTTVV